MLLEELCEGSSYYSIILNKLTVVARKAQKSSYSFDIGRCGPIKLISHLFGIHQYPLPTNNVAEIVNLVLPKATPISPYIYR
jgi:hypothetical protein